MYNPINESLFPEANGILQEALERHKRVFPVVVEAIDLAHLAYDRQRDMAAAFVPGVPSKRRVRNDINDDSWRYLRSIAAPLEAEGAIRSFITSEGGDLMVMPDGMLVRLKKGGPGGETSNYPTPHIRRLGRSTDRVLFSGATALDVAIQQGVMFDVVYVAGLALGEYTHVGFRFAVAEGSPFVGIDAPSSHELMQISPAVFSLVTDARAKLAS